MRERLAQAAADAAFDSWWTSATAACPGWTGGGQWSDGFRAWARLAWDAAREACTVEAERLLGAVTDPRTATTAGPEELEALVRELRPRRLPPGAGTPGIDF